jgi:DNA-binding CsgD family transcriptional regulator
MDVPELHQLTSREYEIVVRLSSGERVPTIARGLFLSESTVRNHLTAVYRKFGVRSQAELVTRLQSSDASRPEADEPHL